MMADEILFFGARGGMGHHLWTPEFHLGRRADALVPASLRPCHIDTKLAPKDPTQREGRARLHHIDGWTVVAWWDRSVDRRPGSNSAFLMRGTHPFHAVLLAAGERFPALLPRFATLELAPS